MCVSIKAPLQHLSYERSTYIYIYVPQKILPWKHHKKKPTTAERTCDSGARKACGGPTDTDFLFNYFLQFIAEPTASPVTTMPYSIPNSYRKALTWMTGAGDVGASLVVSNALLCPYWFLWGVMFHRWVITAPGRIFQKMSDFWKITSPYWWA